MSDFNGATTDNGTQGSEETTVPGNEGQQHQADTSGANEGAGGNEADAKEPKTFTEEDVNRIVEKRIAKERAKQARDQEAKAREDKILKAPVADLDPDDFDSPQDYADAVTAKRIQLLEEGRQGIKQELDVEEGFVERMQAARDKYADFASVALVNTFPVTVAMGEAIQESDVGPEVLYYLGKNHDEAKRIAQLTPARQAAEIGRLEAKVAAEGGKTQEQQKKVSDAPPPIAPGDNRPAKSGRPFDPNDPWFDKNMTTSEWIEASREYQRKKATGR